MLDNNWESSADKCFIGPAFNSVVEGGHEGWEYKDEVGTAADAAKRGALDVRVCAPS